MKTPKPKRASHRARMQIARFSVLLTGGLMALAFTALLITGCASKPVATIPGPDGVQTVKVIVKHGYSPSMIMARAGKPLKIEFYRDEESGVESCAQELVIPSENVKIPLPNHESQIVEIKPQAPDSSIEFQCGMHMLKGKISFK